MSLIQTQAYGCFYGINLSLIWSSSFPTFPSHYYLFQRIPILTMCLKQGSSSFVIFAYSANDKYNLTLLHLCSFPKPSTNPSFTFRFHLDTTVGTGFIKMKKYTSPALKEPTAQENRRLNTMKYIMHYKLLTNGY